MANQNVTAVLNRGLRITAAVCLALALPAFAADVQYSYDELGRVLQAVDQTAGQVTTYAYDSAGNVVAASTTPIATLAVTGFSPNQGAIGSTVTLQGSGFNSTPASNTVRFNGVAATNIVSGTTTSLVVQVPTGASTGTVSVTNGSNTVTSTDAFTVTNAGLAPTITGFTPGSGAAAVTTTISGTNFQTDPTLDHVDFNGASATITGATATSLTVVVPANTGSGKIRVTTPFGSATSVADFIIPPTGSSTSNIVTSGRIGVDGGGQTVAENSNSSSAVTVELFDGTIGQYLTLVYTNNTFTNALVSVYRPDGTLLTSQSLNSQAIPLQLPRLPDTGTYSIVVAANGSPGSATMTLMSPLTGTLMPDAPSLAFLISPPGIRAVASFAGIANTEASININGNTLADSYVSVFDPNGGLILSAELTTASMILSPFLPEDGTYTVLIDPVGPLSGAINLSLSMSAAQVIPSGSYAAQYVTAQYPVNFTFAGEIGQSLQLIVSETNSAVSAATVTITKPSGTPLMSGQFNAQRTVFELPTLSESGSYAVSAQPTGGGALTFAVLDHSQSLSFAASPNPAGVGQPVTMTARADASLCVSTGAMVFKDGTATLGSVTMSGGVATLTTTSLASGTHPLTASCSSDAQHPGGVSTAVAEVINSTWTPNVLLRSTLNPADVGNIVTISALVVGKNTATGTVQFKDGSTVLGTGTLSTGMTAIAVSSFSGGVHNIVASYSGDSNNAAGVSSALSQFMRSPTTTSWIIPPPSQVTVQTPTTVQVQVNGIRPTGTITITFNGSTMVSSPLVPVSDSAARASATFAFVTGGISGPLTAQYSGDADNAPSSVNQQVTVNKANPTFAWQSSFPSTVGVNQSFSDSIWLTGGGASLGSVNPSGTVTFLDNGAAMGAAVTLGCCGTGGTATASKTFMFTTVGTHNITVQYSGDASNNAIVSPVTTIMVNAKTNPTFAWNPAFPSTVGINQSFSNNIWLTGAGTSLGTVNATGTVTFLDNGTAMGAAVTLGCCGTGGTSTATKTFTFTTVGTHNITVQYSGDASNNAIVSPVTTIVVH